MGFWRGTGPTVYENFWKDSRPKTPHYFYGTVDEFATDGVTYRPLTSNAIRTRCFGYIVPGRSAVDFGHELLIDSV
jgi:hypothetical protein